MPSLSASSPVSWLLGHRPPSPVNKRAFRRQIRAARLARLWDYADLGKAAGVSTNAVRLFEMGLGASDSTILKVASVLNVSVEMKEFFQPRWKMLLVGIFMFFIPFSALGFGIGRSSWRRGMIIVGISLGFVAVLESDAFRVFKDSAQTPALLTVVVLIQAVVLTVVIHACAGLLLAKAYASDRTPMVAASLGCLMLAWVSLMPMRHVSSAAQENLRQAQAVSSEIKQEIEKARETMPADSPEFRATLGAIVTSAKTKARLPTLGAQLRQMVLGS